MKSKSYECIESFSVADPDKPTLIKIESGSSWVTDGAANVIIKPGYVRLALKETLFTRYVYVCITLQDLNRHFKMIS